MRRIVYYCVSGFSYFPLWRIIYFSKFVLLEKEEQGKWKATDYKSIRKTNIKILFTNNTISDSRIIVYDIQYAVSWPIKWPKPIYISPVASLNSLRSEAVEQNWTDTATTP